MNIVQIRYTKYHSSGDKAQINIEYIFTMCMILQRKKHKKARKDTVQTTTTTTTTKNI